MDVGQETAVVGTAGQSVPVDLNEPRGGGRGRGQVVMGGGGGGMRPQLPLAFTYGPVAVAVGASPQEEVGQALGAGLRGSGTRPEERGGGGRAGGGASQGGGGGGQGRGGNRGSLVEGGGIGASVGSRGATQRG